MLDLMYTLIMMIEIPNEIVFTIGVLLGMVGHYAKKSWKGETFVSLIAWFTHANFRQSIVTIFAAGSVVEAAMRIGMIDHTASWLVVFYAGLTTGYTTDSIFNSDAASAAVDDGKKDV